MRQALSKHSPALVVSVLALVAAVGGTAVAGDPGAATSAKVSKKKVKKLANKQITKRAPGLSVANAATLDGHPPSDFVSSARLREFDVTLNGGESRELLQAGALTFTGTCTQNATDDGGSANQDFFQIIISTAQNGALFDGFDEKRGRNPGDFLDIGTPASDRVFQEVSTSAIGPGATGVQTFESASDDGAAISPDGARVFGRGDQLAVAFNQYGGVCRAFGIFNVLG